MARRRTMDYTIADRLTELRRAHGYSQESLAAELGLTRQAVSRWERGGSLPDTENLVALADLYDVTIDELVRPQRVAEADGEPDEGERDADSSDAAPEEPLLAEPLASGLAEASQAGLVLDEAVAPGASAPEAEAPDAASLPEASVWADEPTEGDVDVTAASGQAATAAASGPEPAAGGAPAAAAGPPEPLGLGNGAGVTDGQPEPDRSGGEGASAGHPRFYVAKGCLAKAVAGCLVACAALGLLVAGGCTLFRWRTAEVVAEYPDTTLEVRSDDGTEWSSADNTAEVFVDADQVEGLSIDWAAGSVEVRVVDDEEIGPGVIVTEEYLDKRAAEYPMKVGVEHGTLVISYCDYDPFGLQMSKGKRLTVRIPATLATQLQNVSCDLAGGSLELADLTCQALALELAGGTMDVRDVVARDLDVEVAAGEANVRGSFAGAVDMDLSAGSVRVSSGVVPAATDIDVSLGEVVLELPSDASFKANVDKAGGSFELDFQATKKGDTYTVGSGKSTVDVDIAGGSVHIRER